MKVVLLTLFLHTGLPLAAHAQFSAGSLVDLCNSENETDRYRCLGYLQGYLEGANDVNQRTADEVINQAAQQSAWVKRALETRVGREFWRMSRDAMQPFCLDVEDPTGRLKARILAETDGAGRPEGDVPAARWLHGLVDREFACDQPA